MEAPRWYKQHGNRRRLLRNTNKYRYRSVPSSVHLHNFFFPIGKHHIYYIIMRLILISVSFRVPYTSLCPFVAIYWRPSPIPKILEPDTTHLWTMTAKKRWSFPTKHMFFMLHIHCTKFVVSSPTVQLQLSPTVPQNACYDGDFCFNTCSHDSQISLGPVWEQWPDWFIRATNQNEQLRYKKISY